MIRSPIYEGSGISYSTVSVPLALFCACVPISVFTNHSKWGSNKRSRSTDSSDSNMSHIQNHKAVGFIELYLLSPLLPRFEIIKHKQKCPIATTTVHLGAVGLLLKLISSY